MEVMKDLNLPLVVNGYFKKNTCTTVLVLTPEKHQYFHVKVHYSLSRVKYAV